MSAIALAAAARGLDDDALAAALRARGVTGNGIRDFFDLAEVLLSPDSIQQALASLDRPALAALAALTLAYEGMDTGTTDAAVPIDDIVRSLSEHGDGQAVRSRVDELTALLLCGRDGDALTPFAEVGARLLAWPSEGLPGTSALLAPYPPTLVPDPPADTRILDRLAAEHAFSAVSAIAELLRAITAEPARELAKGGLSLPDSKRLALAMGVPIESLPVHLRAAARAGLAVREGNEWMPGEGAAPWLSAPTAQRWTDLAEAWYSAMPPDVHEVLAEARLPWGPALRAYIEWLHPAAGEAITVRVDAFAAEGELLGVTAGGTPSTPGALLLRGRLDEARSALAALLPPEIEKVYLQNDLTVVAPGPLTPAVDSKLRAMADAEGRELASSYRMSAASVGRAIAAGETAQSILDFLAGVALTGVPQPLQYLVTDAAARYGRVRVGPTDDGSGARSYVRSDDAALVGQIAVDKTVAAIALARTASDRLVSRFEPAVVFWALSDARYPVVAEDGDGTIVQLARRTAARAEVVARPDPVIDLVIRLRAADETMGESGTAWLARRIEVAIREKRSIIVSVRMPGGAVSDYELEPTAVANGRMRARDRKSDIERTLPLSSIDAIS